MNNEPTRRSLARQGVELAEAFWDIQLTLQACLCDDPSEALIALQDELAALEGIPFDSPSALVSRIGNLKIEIYANEHAPPHFHVKSPDVDASFRISDGSLLNGDISSKHRLIVEEFFSDNRKQIVAFWNRTRPDGCPVGFVWEDPEGPGGIHEVRGIPAPKGISGRDVSRIQPDVKSRRTMS